jgi:hypothetical protein
MAMLPAGFKTHSTQGTYEQSSKVTVDGRGGPPTHNADGYKQMDIGKYTDGVSDAAKGSETVKGDANEEKAYAEITLVTSSPTVYSRDWSDASK